MESSKASLSPPKEANEAAAEVPARVHVDNAPVANEPEIVVEIEGPDNEPQPPPNEAPAPGDPAPSATAPSDSVPSEASSSETTPGAAPKPVEVPKAEPVRAPPSRRQRRAAAFAPLEPALAVTPVRRFFSRLTVQDTNPLAESPWPQVRVESFFLALTQPRQGVLRGRGPAVAEPQALADAFADFVWD